MDYIALTKQLVKGCLDKGADQAEVYLETSRNLSIEVRNGEIETVEEAATHGVGFRVFVGGKMAFSSCNDFSDSALENAMSKAIEFDGCVRPV
jgi:PmbA protein